VKIWPSGLRVGSQHSGWRCAAYERGKGEGERTRIAHGGFPPSAWPKVGSKRKAADDWKQSGKGGGWHPPKKIRGTKKWRKKSLWVESRERMAKAVKKKIKKQQVEQLTKGTN